MPLYFIDIISVQSKAQLSEINLSYAYITYLLATIIFEKSGGQQQSLRVVSIMRKPSTEALTKNYYSSHCCLCNTSILLYFSTFFAALRLMRCDNIGNIKMYHHPGAIYLACTPRLRLMVRLPSL